MYKPSRQTIWTAIGFCAIIAGMTWYDLSGVGRLDDDYYEKTMVQGYFVGQNTPASAIPEDAGSLAIWAGAISETGETVSLTQAGMAPRLFPQRQIDLYYQLSGVPTRLTPAFDLIKQSVKAWEKENNTISDVFIEFTQDQPDLSAVASFAKGLKSHLELSYRVNLVARSNWFTPRPDSVADDAALQEIQRTVGRYAFDQNEAIEKNLTPDDFIAAIEQPQFPYYIILDESMDSAQFDKDYSAKAKFFGGFIKALRQDAGAPATPTETESTSP